MDANGLKYEEAIVTASSELSRQQALAEKVDAFFIPHESMVQSAMPLVAEVAKDEIPVYDKLRVK
jgi:putative ABC transport system substrate-binding protein